MRCSPPVILSTYAHHRLERGSNRKEKKNRKRKLGLHQSFSRCRTSTIAGHLRPPPSVVDHLQHPPPFAPFKMNSIIDMIDNENFSIISQAVVVTDLINIDNEVELNEILEDGIGDNDDEEASFDNNVEVPSTCTDMEGTNLTSDDNWIVTQSMSKNDFTRELGKDSFKNKEELVRAIKIHIIGTHRQFEVIESHPTIWTLRYKLYLQSGCKWKLHAKHESYDTWDWFLSHVKNHVVKDREGICLIFDRHGGILKAINEHGSPWLEPRGFHRYCLRHFINNFYDKFRNSEMEALAYRVGSQNQIRKFNSIMEEIGKLNPRARQWLESHPLNRWTLAHDGGRRYGLLTTNLSEIFNSVLKGSSSQANGDAYTPYVVVKQVALMAKASAHSLRSFNQEKGSRNSYQKTAIDSLLHLHLIYDAIYIKIKIKSRKTQEFQVRSKTKATMAVGVHDILENAQKVCTTWRNICKDPAMWRVIYMENIYTDPNARPRLREMCKNAVDRSQGQLVDITMVNFTDDELLEYVADRSSRLKRLEIACCYGEIYGSFNEALKKFPLLEELSLHATNISEESIATAGRCCPMLRTLKINQEADRYWYGYDGDEGLNILNEIPIYIGENLHELRHLELIGMNISNYELKVILDGCCHLESLDLRQCLYVNLEGEFGKKLSEKIKCLKLPNDSVEGCPYIYKNGVNFSTEPRGSDYDDSDYDDSEVCYHCEVYDDSDDFTVHHAFGVYADDDDLNDIEDLELLLL
ncbi:unnamed protein product [Lactuca virosa]|uniref:Uncharacterized protein n=1 Tax=Lactuca virosa TaxID=75947 RepID=A0AAU9N681_9ASTR|nr:unnamed protein product [Lactuca virosa]